MKALQIVQKFYPEVTRVSDAAKPMTIQVTRRDIKKSTVQTHNSCAIASACKREKQVDGVIVAVRIAYMIYGKKATRYSIPESLAREIVAFDRNGDFAPGEYRLGKPEKKLGDPAARGSETRKKKGKKVVYRHLTNAIRAL